MTDAPICTIVPLILQSFKIDKSLNIVVLFPQSQDKLIWYSGYYCKLKRYRIYSKATQPHNVVQLYIMCLFTMDALFKHMLHIL